jgi:hypothetical protein
MSRKGKDWDGQPTREQRRHKLDAEERVRKVGDKLEEAREAMHANRTQETIRAYKVASRKMVEARQAYREEYVPAGGPGSAVTETVKVKSKVEKP